MPRGDALASVVGIFLGGDGFRPAGRPGGRRRPVPGAGTFRPRGDPLRELAVALAEAGAGRSGWPTRDALVEQLLRLGGDGHTVVLDLARRVRDDPGRRDATALLVVDQLEELLVDGARPGPMAPTCLDAWTGSPRSRGRKWQLPALTFLASGDH